MVTIQQINSFLAPKKLAIAGVSRNSKKFGNSIYRDLKKKGYKVYAVNPNADEVEGDVCYKSLAELPEDVTHLYIITPKSGTDVLIEEAINSNINMIWIQQMSETKKSVELASKSNIELIVGKCLYMFLDPVSGIHGFHKFLSKTFGHYPTAN